MHLIDLYRAVTGDTASHQRAVHARVLKLDARRRRLIEHRIAGKTLRQISDLEGVSHGSVQSAINGALEAVRKDIANEPRYNAAVKVGATQE